MATKTTKKTSSVKNESINLRVGKSDSKTSVSSASTKSSKGDSSKKVIVKRRKLDLTPTRASAVAIASQANRAKKSSVENSFSRTNIKLMSDDNSTKIPLWVWFFFGFSLLLFCVAFYQAIIRPQLEVDDIIDDSVTDTVYWSSESKGESESGELLNSEVSNENAVENVIGNAERLQNPEQVIQAYFAYLSEGKFDEAFDLFSTNTQSDRSIREHFTSFRLAPFLDGVEGHKLQPTNIHYMSSNAGKDKYGFDLSYVLSSTQDRYDESWEFVINMAGNEPKILSVVCTTKRCSYHPIFWPENFGLLR